MRHWGPCEIEERSGNFERGVQGSESQRARTRQVPTRCRFLFRAVSSSGACGEVSESRGGDKNWGGEGREATSPRLEQGLLLDRRETREESTERGRG